MSDQNRPEETGAETTDLDPDRDPRDDPDQIVGGNRRRNTAIVSGVIAVFGAWIALSVIIYDVAQATLWNNVVVGVAVFLAAGYNYYRQYNDVPLSVGVASLVALLGIWLVVAAAFFDMIAGAFWSTLVTGLLIAGLAGYNVYEGREARAVATEPDTGTP